MTSLNRHDGIRDDHSSSLPDSGVAISGSFTELIKRFRVFLLVIGHLVAFCITYYLALIIRYETIDVFHLNLDHNPSLVRDLVYFGLPFVALTKLVVFYLMKNFHGWWRYVTFSDVVSLAKAATVSLVVIITIDHFVLPFQIPRKVVLTDWVFTMVVLGALRSVWRLWDEKISVLKPGSRQRKRALLIGSDGDAARLAHQINSQPSLGFNVVGLVSARKMGPIRFSDLRVVGSVDEIEDLCKAFRVRTVYVTAGLLAAKQMRSLLDAASENEVKINVVPKFGSFLDGGSKIPIRDVQLEDLLRRPPAKLDLQAIRNLVESKTVLVTGAGGSIGSELCRQLVKFKPGRLILLGRGENRIYQIDRELGALENETELISALASVTDRSRMEKIISEYRPEVIFHAAAHKHVPLTEQNIGEAVNNNVLGTRIVAELAHIYEVAKFVFVSTDKAVNPTSVMGCTKHIAERFVLALGSESETQFVVTRFGNVLGSAGSVVPLFKEQIKRGGPITITDERMTRFFMTIPEASQLVVQAAAMGRGGEIFVLEMGQPVLIKNLARDLIRFAGLPASSIDIVYTGIRPGEKLYEELYYNDEKSLPTSHEKILTAYHRPFDLNEVAARIDTLLSMAYGDSLLIKREMKRMVPEFHDRDNVLKEVMENESTGSTEMEAGIEH